MQRTCGAGPIPLTYVGPGQFRLGACSPSFRRTLSAHPLRELREAQAGSISPRKIFVSDEAEPIMGSRGKSMSLTLPVCPGSL